MTVALYLFSLNKFLLVWLLYDPVDLASFRLLLSICTFQAEIC